MRCARRRCARSSSAARGRRSRSSSSTASSSPPSIARGTSGPATRTTSSRRRRARRAGTGSSTGPSLRWRSNTTCRSSRRTCRAATRCRSRWRPRDKDARALPPAFVAAHEASIARGHCDLLPPEALPGMAARRSRAIVRSRRRSGRMRSAASCCSPAMGTRAPTSAFRTGSRRRSVRARLAIGVLERDADATGEPTDRFDAYVLTAPAPRADPCEDLRKRMGKQAK